MAPHAQGSTGLVPVRWTMGQEYEIYVPFLWNESSDPLPPDTARKVIRIKKPINWKSMRESARKNYVKKQVARGVVQHMVEYGLAFATTKDDLEAAHYTEEDGWRDFWVVKTECGLEEKENQDAWYDGWVPMEITSKITTVFQYRNSSEPWRFEEGKPGRFVERLNASLRFVMDEHCSYHLHLRLRDGNFDLLTLKKLATLLWLGEPRLNKLYDPSRTRGDQDPLYRPLRRCSSLKMENEAFSTGTTADFDKWISPVQLPEAEEDRLRILWKANSQYELLDLMHCHHKVRGKMSYNFSNLHKLSNKGTVEFRQMEATQKPDVVNAWAEVFLQLLSFSRGNSQEEFWQVIVNLCDMAIEFDTWHFLKAIGCCPKVVSDLRKKQLAQNPCDEEAFDDDELDDNGKQSRRKRELVKRWLKQQGTDLAAMIGSGAGMG